MSGSRNGGDVIVPSAFLDKLDKSLASVIADWRLTPDELAQYPSGSFVSIVTKEQSSFETAVDQYKKLVLQKSEVQNNLDLEQESAKAENAVNQILEMINGLASDETYYPHAVNVINLMAQEIIKISDELKEYYKNKNILIETSKENIQKLEEIFQLIKRFQYFKPSEEYIKTLQKLYQEEEVKIANATEIQNKIQSIQDNLSTNCKRIDDEAKNKSETMLNDNKKKILKAELIGTIDEYFMARNEKYSVLDTLQNILHKLFACLCYKTEKQEREEYAANVKQAIHAYTEDGKKENKEALRNLLKAGITTFKPRTNDAESEEYKDTFKFTLENIEHKIK